MTQIIIKGQDRLYDLKNDAIEVISVLIFVASSIPILQLLLR